MVPAIEKGLAEFAGEDLPRRETENPPKMQRLASPSRQPGCQSGHAVAASPSLPAPMLQQNSPVLVSLPPISYVQ
jgi:hypothetical protein